MTKCQKCGWKTGDPGDICDENHGTYYRDDCYDYNKSKPRLTLGFLIAFTAYCAIIITLQHYVASGEIDPKTNVNDHLMVSLLICFLASFSLLPIWNACGGRQAVDGMDAAVFAFGTFIVAAMYMVFMP